MNGFSFFIRGPGASSLSFHQVSIQWEAAGLQPGSGLCHQNRPGAATRSAASSLQNWEK